MNFDVFLFFCKNGLILKQSYKKEFNTKGADIMLQYENEILLPDEVCEILHIGKNTLYKLLNNKELIGYRVGRNWKIPKRAVVNYIMRKTKGE